MQGVKEAREQIQGKSNMEAIDLVAYKRYFLKIAEKTTRGVFKVDERNREIVGALFNYFMGVPGSLDLDKGLWLDGPVGTGKSTLMQVFSAFMRDQHKGFKVFSCAAVARCYAIDGNLDFFMDNRDGYLREPVDICFDELGRESIPANYYGTKQNVMQVILYTRYDLWKTRGIKTYVTTNSDSEDIEQLYGDFIRDRRREMFNIIPVVGESRR